MKNLILIDGHYFLFRAFGAPFKFHSKGGTPLHVLTVYLNMLRRAVRAVPGEDVGMIVAFDSPVASSNHLLLETYKANRNYDYSDQDDNPFEHMPLVKKTLEYLNIPWLEMPGHEADDIIASILTKHVQTEGNKGFICSADSDFFQLLSDEIKVIRLAKGMVEILLDPEWLKVELNITPEQYVEFKSMVGDTADNIKGVKGIGRKSAAAILNQEKERTFTAEELDILELNRKLVKLNCEMDIDTPASSVQQLLQEKNDPIFAALEF